MKHFVFLMIVCEGYIPRLLGRIKRVCTLRQIPYSNNIPRPLAAGLLILPPLAACLLFLLALVFFSGCYTLKQGTAMLGYLGKAVPLGKLAEGAEEDRLFAERVADITRFAMEELGLRKSKNYTTYVRLDRDYLAAVVSACAADSFTRHEWRFPVVGTVPYKGFFDPEDAKKEAARLRADGLDVWIRKVDAFSTLGWFRDPLYSYMKDYSAYQLADLIIHELFHATVFIKGQVQFNEQLAEFTGGAGARLYIESRFGGGSEEYRNIDAGEADSKTFIRFLRDIGADLEKAYNNPLLSRDEKLAEKEKIIKAAQEHFRAAYTSLFSGGAYRGFAELPLNNAYLDLYRLYYEDRFFADMYAKTAPGKSETARLKTFIAAAKTINPRTKNPQADLQKVLSL